jgi:hypothetical protein
MLCVIGDVYLQVVVHLEYEMRTKKIRGHRRRWKEIDSWVESHKNLDLDYLQNRQRNYAKIRVHPWSGISMLNSEIPVPHGETKIRILSGLIEIYESWKIKLDQLGEPYYLKLWLFEQRFKNSQVVCAIGDFLDFYGNTFYKPDYSKKLNAQDYGRLDKAVSEFSWDYRLDEDHFDNSEPGSPELYATLEDYEEDKRWFQKILKKPHRTTVFEQPIGEATESYSFKKGCIWLGEK